ncbi:MAG: type II toxin-antitoxin system HicB family antitoxin [Myxococcota bacterium]
MRYHFKIHKDKTKGYWAQGVELPGCFSQAETREELRISLVEALNLYLSEPEDSKLIFPSPKKNTVESKVVWAVEVDPKVAFAVTLKNLRLKKNLSQSQMKEKLGIKHLSAYQRLEDPRRANPRLLTLKKIKSVFPSVRIDQILAA